MRLPVPGQATSPGTALTQALAAIDRWRRHLPHLILKRLARDALELGAHDVRVHVRYGARAEAIAERALDLGGAIIACERAYRRELAAAESAERLWAIRRPRIDLMVLSELRLLLRFFRRHAPQRFDEILGAIIACYPPRALPRRPEMSTLADQLGGPAYVAGRAPLRPAIEYELRQRAPPQRRGPPQCNASGRESPLGRVSRQGQCRRTAPCG
jgi:hypothetical protein